MCAMFAHPSDSCAVLYYFFTFSPLYSYGFFTQVCGVIGAGNERLQGVTLEFDAMYIFFTFVLLFYTQQVICVR